MEFADWCDAIDSRMAELFPGLGTTYTLTCGREFFRGGKRPSTTMIAIAKTATNGGAKFGPKPLKGNNSRPREPDGGPENLTD